MSIRTFLHFVFRTNLFQTIRFNFKMFPFVVAKKLPVWFYGKVVFRSLAGKVIINGPVSSGMIKIGKNDYYVDTSIQLCIWTIRGNLIFNGPLSFGHGSYVLISDNAKLEFGTKGTYLGSNLKIMCFEGISIGDNVRIAWDCQFMDTSFHYIENLNKEDEIKPLTKPIVIGDRVWIGNRTTITKGAIIPSDIIVTSNSLVNKDFSKIEPYCMIAGAPAMLKSSGLRRVFDEKRQAELDNLFNYTRTHL